MECLTSDNETGRRFRACRTCKRQKVRCDGEGKEPCRRCRSAGCECIFDIINERRRERASSQGVAPDVQRISSLEAELQHLRGVVDSLNESRQPEKQLSPPTTIGETVLPGGSDFENTSGDSQKDLLSGSPNLPWISHTNSETSMWPTSPQRRAAVSNFYPGSRTFETAQATNNQAATRSIRDSTVAQDVGPASSDEATTSRPRRNIMNHVQLGHSSVGSNRKIQDTTSKRIADACTQPFVPRPDSPQPDIHKLGDITQADLCAPVFSVVEMTAANGDSSDSDGGKNRMLLKGGGSGCDDKIPEDERRTKRRRIVQQPPMPNGALEKCEDLVSKGTLSETKARELFSFFFAGCSDFLPLFDPVLDNFDALRVRSTFCFTAILYISAKISAVRDEPLKALRDTCHREARHHAADSLFEKSPPLESVQAMILMAAYSENSWFAIGHAIRLARQARLDKALASLMSASGSTTVEIDAGERAITEKIPRTLAREIRTWLILFHLEKEIAFGMARPSILDETDVLDSQDLLSHSLSMPSDVRFISTIELTRLRGRFHKRISKSEYPHGSAIADIAAVSENLDGWLKIWDKVYEDKGFHKMSFHRASLQIQRNYVEIFICCAVLDKMQTQRRKSLEAGAFVRGTDDVILHTVKCVESQLEYILASSSYRWYLKWAPNYSALTLAFTTVFALKLLRLRPDLIEKATLVPLSRRVTELLDHYPSTCYRRLVQLLISLPQVKIPLDPNNFQASGHSSSQSATASVPLQATVSTFKSIWGASPSVAAVFSEQPCPARNEYTSGDSNISEMAPLELQTSDLGVPSWNPADVVPTELAQLDSDTRNVSGFEVPGWMLDWSHIESIGLPEEGNASLFDFDTYISATALPSDFD